MLAEASSLMCWSLAGTCSGLRRHSHPRKATQSRGEAFRLQGHHCACGRHSMEVHLPPLRVDEADPCHQRVRRDGPREAAGGAGMDPQVADRPACLPRALHPGTGVRMHRGGGRSGELPAADQSWQVCIGIKEIKTQLSSYGVIQKLVKLVRKSDAATQRLAASALCNLSANHLENKIMCREVKCRGRRRCRL